MKIAFRICIFVLMFLFVGCTITKRRYMGGYSINWNSKMPSPRIIPKTQSKENILNKISSTSNKPGLVLETKKIFPFVGGEQANMCNQQQKGILKEGLLKLPSQSIVHDKYRIVARDTTSESTSKKDIRKSSFFCLLGFLALLVAFFPLALFSPSILDVILLVPLLFFIISLIHSFRAIKEHTHRGVFIYLLLDIVGLVVVGSIISAIIFSMAY